MRNLTAVDESEQAAKDEGNAFVAQDPVIPGRYTIVHPDGSLDRTFSTIEAAKEEADLKDGCN